MDWEKQGTAAAARLGEQVVDGQVLRVVAQHLERVALRRQVLLGLQHLRNPSQHPESSAMSWQLNVLLPMNQAAINKSSRRLPPPCTPPFKAARCSLSHASRGCGSITALPSAGTQAI
jgi:hypothetical protein